MNQPNQHRQTPLHTAAGRGDTDVVRYYIQEGADIMAQDKDGRTPLHLAAKNVHGPAVRELLKLDPAVRELLELDPAVRELLELDGGLVPVLERVIPALGIKPGYPRFPSRLPKSLSRLVSQGNQQTLARVNARDKYGRTALHYAAEENGNEVVRLLVESGASVNTFDSQECAALPQPAAVLEWGVKNRHNRMVRGLLEQGVDGENGGLDYGQRTLGLAADYGDMDMILQLVEDYGVNLKTLSGQKALIFVVESEDLYTLKIMIAKGADVDAEFEGKTVLYRAAEKRKWQIVEMLAEKGANIDAAYKGRTALVRAAEEYDYSDVRKLAEIGANVDAEFEGTTALWRGRGGAHPGILAEIGANVNFEYKGETALSKAASREQWGQVKYLIELGADVNVLVNGLPLLFRVLDEDLHADGRGYHLDLVEMVVERVREGINEANHHGETALHLAVASRLWKTVSQLVAKGANTELVDDYGSKPRDWLAKDKDKQRYDKAVEQGSRPSGRE